MNSCFTDQSRFVQWVAIFCAEWSRGWPGVSWGREKHSKKFYAKQQELGVKAFSEARFSQSTTIIGPFLDGFDSEYQVLFCDEIEVSSPLQTDTAWWSYAMGSSIVRTRTELCIGSRSELTPSPPSDRLHPGQPNSARSGIGGPIALQSPSVFRKYIYIYISKLCGCRAALRTTVPHVSRAQRLAQTATTHARAGALVSQHLAWMRARHGWVPVNTHSAPLLGPLGRLWVAHIVRTTEHHKHNQWAHDNIPREMKVSHGSGAMGCETMAMETVTMNVTEQEVPNRQTTPRGIAIFMPQILMQRLKCPVLVPQEMVLEIVSDHKEETSQLDAEPSEKVMINKRDRRSMTASAALRWKRTTRSWRPATDSTWHFKCLWRQGPRTPSTKCATRNSSWRCRRVPRWSTQRAQRGCTRREMLLRFSVREQTPVASPMCQRVTTLTWRLVESSPCWSWTPPARASTLSSSSSFYMMLHSEFEVAGRSIEFYTVPFWTRSQARHTVRPRRCRHWSVNCSNCPR